MNAIKDIREPKGLSGWLGLVGLGVVINPLRLLFSFVPHFLSIFRDGTWEALTLPESAVYSPYWGPLIIGEFLFNFSFTAASLYLVFLFFSRHYMFPRVYIGLAAASLAFNLIDSGVISLIFPGKPMFDPQSSRELTMAIVSCFIWIPYMVHSKRARATFVEKEPVPDNRPS